MKIVASYVNSVKSKTGKLYYRFAVVPTGDTISASADYSPLIPESGKKYILDIQARIASSADGEKAFLAGNVMCEAIV